MPPLVHRIMTVRRAIEEQRLLATFLRHIAPTLVRTLSRPTLGELTSTGGFHTDVSSALLELLSQEVDETRIEELGAEFQILQLELDQRYSRLSDSGRLGAPEAFAVERTTARLFFSLVRVLNPTVVLETGVANGHSTYFALKALALNRLGTLFSTDIEANRGSLLTSEERQSWHFRQLPPEHVRRAFAALVQEISPIQLFLHDSEHTYAWQMFEYMSVWRRLPRRGMLVSDDIDASYAFLDFRRSVECTAIVLLDERKAVGVLRKA